MIAAVGEFEADLISERTFDGPAAARARGRKGGRRPKLNERQVAMVTQMAASGEHTISAIAQTFNVSRPTIHVVLDAGGLDQVYGEPENGHEASGDGNSRVGGVAFAGALPAQGREHQAENRHWPSDYPD